MGNKKNSLNTTISPSQNRKSSKKRRVLSSDDEDDVVPLTPVDKPKQKLAEKRKLINPVDVFGSEPVKQSAINVIKPKKKNQVCIIIITVLK